MSGAVCPSCGVPVVPGYVRCPKCHKPLPRRRGTHIEGGTAVEPATRFPVVAIVAALVLGAGIIIFFTVIKSDKPKPQAGATTEQPPEATGSEAVQTPDQPEAPEQQQEAAPDPQKAATDFERVLKKNRMWSTVEIVGDHVDVRSGMCSDPGMAPLLDGAAPTFKEAGLTRMRCVEQSGRVVTERHL